MPKKPKRKKLRMDPTEVYLAYWYPGEKPKPRFKLGQLVHFRRQWKQQITQGLGVVQDAFCAFGNLPVRYHVKGFNRGFLFEDELRMGKQKGKP